MSASQRKKIKTDDHLSMCNCSGATELDKAVKFRISRSAWCTFSRGGQIRGYVPRENEHHGAHFRGWCTNSLANLCAGARLRGGERIRCYTGSGSHFVQLLSAVVSKICCSCLKGGGGGGGGHWEDDVYNLEALQTLSFKLPNPRYFSSSMMSLFDSQSQPSRRVCSLIIFILTLPRFHFVVSSCRTTEDCNRVP